jgi:cytoskeletal protein CcmA (bactofilin family)
MALQSNFFGKRDAESLNPANRPAAPGGSGSGGLSSGSSLSGAATSSGVSGGSSALGAGRVTPGGVSSSSNAATAPVLDAAVSAGSGESASRLTVGPNIKLKGVEITDCDTLVVEGMVEATMDSRVIQIAEQGAFKGSAEIDIAEIRGVFDGNLTAREKLVIYATGRVTGKIRYGKLVVEEGGQLSGEIHVSGAHVPTGGSGTSGSSGVDSGTSLHDS